MEMFFWLFLAYVSGTFIGHHIGKKENLEDFVETIIDKLILDGYIKTKGSGKNLELLKHWEKE